MKKVFLVLCLILISSVTYAVGPYELGAGEWSSQMIGLLGKVGGVAGTFIGVFAAVSVWLTLKGTSRKLVTGVWCFLFALGIAYVLIALLAVADHQAYHVYFPILLAGILNAVLPAAAILLIRKYYQWREMRSMSAQDLGR